MGSDHPTPDPETAGRLPWRRKRMGKKDQPVHEQQPLQLTGYICPSCGGAISRRTDEDGTAEYRCRIGHSFTPERFWIETCAMRNEAVAAAARASAEKVDLARALAGEARALGNDALAARLEEEAGSEERHVGMLLGMLEGLAEADDTERPYRPPAR